MDSKQKLTLSTDALAVWIALALSLIVRLGVLKRVPW
jgi:hypothetical protein